MMALRIQIDSKEFFLSKEEFVERMTIALRARQVRRAALRKSKIANKVS